MKEFKYDAAAIGELLIDFACLSKDPEGYPTMAAHPGGAPANFLAAMNRCGAKTAMIGKVGDDAFGNMLLNTLQLNGIDTAGMITDSSTFTTLAFVTFDEEGDREFSFSRKPGADTRLSFEEIDLSVIDAAKVLHFGTLSLTDEPAKTATQKAVAYAKERGKLISFDPNLRIPLWKDLDDAKEQMLWGLARADVVKISEDEVDFLWGLSPEEGLDKILTEFGAKLVYITCGAAGCAYGTKNIRGFAEAPQGLKIIDTTGAGDIFGGSAMAELLALDKAVEELTDEELRGVVRYACTAASLSATRPGGISSIPDREDVEKQMNS